MFYDKKKEIRRRQGIASDSCKALLLFGLKIDIKVKAMFEAGWPDRNVKNQKDQQKVCLKSERNRKRIFIVLKCLFCRLIKQGCEIFRITRKIPNFGTFSERFPTFRILPNFECFPEIYYFSRFKFS
jgi:hypothetical protein